MNLLLNSSCVACSVYAIPTIVEGVIPVIWFWFPKSKYCSLCRHQWELKSVHEYLCLLRCRSCSNHSLPLVSASERFRPRLLSIFTILKSSLVLGDMSGDASVWCWRRSMETMCVTSCASWLRPLASRLAASSIARICNAASWLPVAGFSTLSHNCSTAPSAGMSWRDLKYRDGLSSIKILSVTY